MRTGPELLTFGQHDIEGRVIDKHPTKLRMFIGIWANNFEFEYPSPGS